jgi:hypothetical protein
MVAPLVNPTRGSRQVHTAVAGMTVMVTNIARRRRAFQINPQCAVMNNRQDKIGCTCGLQNGGWVRHTHGQWRWNYNTTHMDKVHQCIQNAK